LRWLPVHGCPCVTPTLDALDFAAAFHFMQQTVGSRSAPDAAGVDQLGDRPDLTIAQRSPHTLAYSPVLAAAAQIRLCQEGLLPFYKFLF